MSAKQWLDQKMAHACRLGDWVSMKQLVEKGTSVTGVCVYRSRLSTGTADACYNVTAVMLALHSGKCDVGVLKFLQLNGCRPCKSDMEGKTEMMHACITGCDDSILAWLVQNDLRDDYVQITDNNEWMALMYAIDKQHTNIVWWFVKEAMEKKGLISQKDIDFQNKDGLTVLMFASREGYGDIVNILAKAADCNLQDKEGLTAFMYASQKGHNHILMILGKMTDVNWQDNNGRTALMWAIERSHLHTVDWFINETKIQDGLISQHDINFQNDKGTTALIYTCCDGNLQILKCLAQMADLNVEDHSHHTALIWACRKSQTHIVQWFVDEAIKDKGLVNYHDINYQNSTGRTAFMIATRQGWLERIALLAKMANVKLQDNDGLTALMMACLLNQKDVVEWFVSEAKKTKGLILQQDIDGTNRYGLTALMYASYRSKIDMVKILANAADLNLQNFQGETALHVAIAVDEKDEGMFWKVLQPVCSNEIILERKKERPTILKDNVSIVKVLIDYKANLDIQDENGKTSFYLACSVGAVEIAVELQRAGADVHKSTHFGISPVMAAAQNGHLDIVKWFLNCLKITINRKFTFGDTLAIATARKNQGQVLQELIDHGAKVNCENESGSTALIAACESPSDAIVGSEAHFQHEEVRRECVDILLQSGADPLMQNVEGQTALHVTAHYDHTRLVETLLQAMRNLCVTDNCGNTALHIAIQHHQWKVAVILIQAMDDVNTKNRMGRSCLHDICDYLTVVENTQLQERELLNSKERSAAVNSRMKHDFNTKWHKQPLHHAHLHKEKTPINVNMEEALRLLLARSCNINTKDLTGATPLFTLCKRNLLDFAKSFVENGAEISAVNCLGQTILHYCVQQKVQLDIIKWILSKNIDSNCLDYCMRTPLHLAALSRNVHAVPVLVAHGGNLFSTDRNGLTPLVLACRHPETFKVMIDAALLEYIDKANGYSAQKITCISYFM